jgi:hypothetical protein
MEITLEIPDELSSPPFGDPSRIALEALAAKAYEEGVLSEEQVRRMLGLPSCWEARELLSKHGVWPGTTMDDVLSDLEMLESLRAERLLENAVSLDGLVAAVVPQKQDFKPPGVGWQRE